MSQIVTGDAVVLDLRPARIPTRMLATVVDLIVMGSLAWGWLALAKQVAPDSSSRDLLELVGYFTIMLAYPVLWETVTRGRTPGAFALGLRAVRDDGGTIGFRQALIRGLSFWFVDLSIATAFLGGLLCATIDRDGKRIGDMLAGTLVIRLRAPRVTAAVPDPEPGLRSWAERLELSSITDEQIAAARYALQRAAQMKPRYREALMYSLASQVAAVASPPPPSGVSPEAYLTAVLGELRRRGDQRRARSLGIDVPDAWR